METMNDTPKSAKEAANDAINHTAGDILKAVDLLREANTILENIEIDESQNEVASSDVNRAAEAIQEAIYYTIESFGTVIVYNMGCYAYSQYEQFKI